MRTRILTLIGIIMLVSFLALGAFALPIGIPLSSGIGLVYALRYKDKVFLKWSCIGLGVGIVCLVYMLLNVASM